VVVSHLHSNNKRLMAHRHVIQHQAGRAQSRVLGTRCGQRLPPRRFGEHGQASLDRRIRGRGDPDLFGTRRLSSLLVGSMIRASTRPRNTSSPSVADSKLECLVGAIQGVPQVPHP
jgi:hypothetical protein